jgi:hypothetical protein
MSSIVNVASSFTPVADVAGAIGAVANGTTFTDALNAATHTSGTNSPTSQESQKVPESTVSADVD